CHVTGVQTCALPIWGRTRSESINRLRQALDEYEVTGIKTTLPFCREIVRDEEFQSGHLDMGFISRFNERRSAAGVSGSDEHSREIGRASCRESGWLW